MTDFEKSVPLFIVQMIGVCAALISNGFLADFCTIDSRLQKRMRLILAAVCVLSVAFGSLNQGVWRIFGMKHDLILLFMSFSGLLAAYALMDLLVLAFLVHATGGSRLSLYSPFLFIIVPVAIALGENRWRVVLYGGLTIAIFFVMMFWKDKEFKIDKCDQYDWWWGGITILSVSFPTILFLLAS